MGGKPTITGTRLTVELILERLANGHPIEELLEDYPRLTRDGIYAALEYAVALVQAEAARERPAS
jgi:uncharacterized protein (DUF433 family)